MKYYRKILIASVLAVFLAQTAAADGEMETMAILEQGGGEGSGLLIIGLMMVFSVVWLYSYLSKKKKNSRHHHSRHHSHHD